MSTLYEKAIFSLWIGGFVVFCMGIYAVLKWFILQQGAIMLVVSGATLLILSELEEMRYDRLHKKD